ncbi:MAG: tRNA (guanosine(46)-N7)-methyltransferase TrmB, partial [Candidatus Amulumruptor sp.]|nr:tRNA (guanosine(46)-N7)-methyltransferase TrmB [Candidatus Amulumruptor sp.]
YIGVDIKGARMWRGATTARDAGMSNVAFIRTDIELIDRFFAPGEVDEIWITFPDPQMKKVRKRLTSTRFLDLYRRILRPDGHVRLKTDSPFLYTYTRLMAEHCGLTVDALTDDLYASPLLTDILAIKTHYERQWLDRGLSIKYIAIALDHTTELSEPDVDIEPDTYRSYSRGVIQGNVTPEEAGQTPS